MSMPCPQKKGPKSGGCRFAVMKGAKKAKPAVAQAEQLMHARIAAAGGGQAPDSAPLPLHTGV